LVTGQVSFCGFSIDGWSGGSTEVTGLPTCQSLADVLRLFHLPYNWADLVIHGLALWLRDNPLEDWAGRGISTAGAVWNRHLRVLGKSMVVISCRTDDWACLAGLVEVDAWVTWGKDGVGSANDWADLC